MGSSIMTMHMNGHSDTGRRAFEKELLALQPNLRAFAVSLSGRHDRADDLVQDTLFKALQKYESYEMGSNMKAWLFTILRNDFYSNMRKASNKNERAWDEGLDDSILYSTHQQTSGGETYDFQKHLTYIASLPRDQCDSFIAVCYLGMNYEEASAILGVAVGTTKSRVSRARTRLVQLIESNTMVLEAKFKGFKTATNGVPADHPFYPIAQAYEELFAESRDVEKDFQKSERPAVQSEPEPLSEKEKLWKELVASGALEHSEDDLSTLLQTEFEE